MSLHNDVAVNDVGSGSGGNLHIDPAGIDTLIGKINSAAAEYQTCLNDIKTQHNNLKQAWQAGGDVEAYETAVDNHLKAMDDLYTAILGTASDLQKILDAYMEAQATIKGAINNG